MGYFKKGSKEHKEMEISNKETVEDVLSYPFADDEDRGIRKETCKR